MVKNNILSICIIAKNEAKTLAPTLASARTIADEIIVVDTGSGDDTLNVAARNADTVLQYRFKGDFSEVRNFALRRARCRWVMFLDADEVIDARSFRGFKARLSRMDDDYGGISVVRHNYFTDWTFNSHRLVRIVRKNERFNFVRRVHETITVSIIQAGFKILDTSLIVHHLGNIYHGTNTEGKKKYIRMCMQELRENKNDVSLKGILALEYAVQHQLAKAINQLGALVERKKYNSSTTYFLAQFYRLAGKNTLAIRMARETVKISGGFVSRGLAYNLLGLCCAADGAYGNAKKYFVKACDCLEPFPQPYLNRALLTFVTDKKIDWKSWRKGMGMNGYLRQMPATFANAENVNEVINAHLLIQLSQYKEYVGIYQSLISEKKPLHKTLPRDKKKRKRE